ncbi:hypothetical protein [Porphyromonas cangingivalis]|uniref:hypothetical protein n=1 Tax=Porphyromonas cangingivalis TaxID=36874 RepID=UPI00126A3F6F|nr:hypothetical protein [Porphyromonas cangingivalis]
MRTSRGYDNKLALDQRTMSRHLGSVPARHPKSHRHDPWRLEAKAEQPSWLLALDKRRSAIILSTGVPNNGG